jgi:hypothetical protein
MYRLYRVHVRPDDAVVSSATFHVLRHRHLPRLLRRQ